MSDTKLKGALPKDDEANGLAGSEWANRLLDDPQKQHVAVITFVTAKKDTDFASGKVTATAQITRIEPVADEAEAQVLLNKLFDLASARTGRTQLDIPEPVKGAAVLDLNAGRGDDDFDGGDAA
ncbi:hypothetical protein [Humibacter sp. RRB41]|uniref:hypothetical protein n=1 Tax=Humibacter sp. RRB41 TaxID=2919946 RepID=UPI001FA9A848|nr:hypothetical protein [Humibacter sp. RRB41]